MLRVAVVSILCSVFLFCLQHFFIIFMFGLPALWVLDLSFSCKSRWLRPTLTSALWARRRDPRLRSCVVFDQTASRRLHASFPVITFTSAEMSDFAFLRRFSRIKRPRFCFVRARAERAHVFGRPPASEPGGTLASRPAHPPDSCLFASDPAAATVAASRRVACDATSSHRRDGTEVRLRSSLLI